jgi:hypothetical protein
MGLVFAGSTAGLVAQRRSQNRPQPETFQRGGLGSAATHLSPAFPAATVPINSPRGAVSSAPQQTARGGVDPQAWASQQAELQRQTLHIQHQATVQTLQDVYETAQQAQMAIRINGRRVDQAIPVFPRRGSDAMKPGEPLQVAIDRTQAEHLRHVQAANARSSTWFKVVYARQLPGQSTPVLTAITGTRGELEALM